MICSILLGDLQTKEMSKEVSQTICYFNMFHLAPSPSSLYSLQFIQGNVSNKSDKTFFLFPNILNGKFSRKTEILSMYREQINLVSLNLDIIAVALS
jgi:hypothetical protein